MHHLGWLNPCEHCEQPSCGTSILDQNKFNPFPLHKSKSFCSHWIHQEGKTTLTTSAPRRYWAPGFCVSGMTLEVHRKKLQKTSGWQKETTTGVQHRQGVLRSCVGWAGFGGASFAVPCNPEVLPAVGRESLKQLNVTMCHGQVLPSICIILSIPRGVAPDSEQSLHSP